MKRWLREPLLHFVILGAALFLLNGFLSESEFEAGANDIVVTQGRIENLAALFVKTWQRPPTTEELRALVDDHVLEEVLYREGKALGVDQDDTVIRRRVRQKMEFVAEDIIGQAEPTETELEAWLAAHPETYARPARFKFRQVYLNPDRHGGKLQADSTRVLAKLRAMDAEADPRGHGDASLLEHAFEDASADVVARTFGKAFADGLAKVPTGEWSGPIESAFGLHLVIIDERETGRRAALAEVRAAVERDCMHARQKAAMKRFHQTVLSRYRVAIEWPAAPPTRGEAKPEEAQK